MTMPKIRIQQESRDLARAITKIITEFNLKNDLFIRYFNTLGNLRKAVLKLQQFQFGLGTHLYVRYNKSLN